MGPLWGFIFDHFLMFLLEPPKTLILNDLIALFEGFGIPKTTILGHLFGKIFCIIPKPSSGVLSAPLCPPKVPI